MNIKRKALLASTLVASLLSFSVQAKDETTNVKITPDLESVAVVHMGKKMTIDRNQNTSSSIPKVYSKTSRACPPFCIQPASLDPKVDTIAEIEMLDYLKKSSAGDTSIIVIDTRTPDWMARGTIPGSVNIPWTKLSIEGSETWEQAPTANDVMAERFGVKVDGEKLGFSEAKTLIMFCNGAWCPQSTANIKSLLKKGYPAEKLKWYRGGMQAWVTMGLTTTK